MGLSLAWRSAATDTSVTVSAVCPGWVDTPIPDSLPPAELPPLPSAGLIDAREVIAMGNLGVYDPDLLARDVLRGIARDDPLIVTPRSARVLWRLPRYAPRVYQMLDRRLTRQVIALADQRGRAA